MERKFRYERHILFSLILLVSVCNHAFADEDHSGIHAGNRIEDGIYENNGHFFVIRDDRIESEVLKSFYGFWYDGQYTPEDADGTACLTQIGDALYLDWWQREELSENKASGGVFWSPGSNIRECTLSPYPVKEKLTGWFIVKQGSEELVYEITYWQADIECSDDLASFRLPDGTSAFVKKHIQLDGIVYTCAAGRRSVVRNPVLKASLPGTPVYSETSLVMALGEPYLVKAGIEDMQAEIDYHNAIVYPPRFSTMDIKEPSIYKKLEDMPIAW